MTDTPKPTPAPGADQQMPFDVLGKRELEVHASDTPDAPPRVVRTIAIAMLRHQTDQSLYVGITGLVPWAPEAAIALPMELWNGITQAMAGVAKDIGMGITFVAAQAATEGERALPN